MAHAYQIEQETTAEDRFHRDLIKYLGDPTPATTATVNESMKALADVYKDPEALESIQQIFKEYDDNDHERWRKFAEKDGILFFRNNPEYKHLFYEAAEKRNIGSTQWVI